MTSDEKEAIITQLQTGVIVLDRNLKILPTPLIQLCNIRLPSPAGQGGSLSHPVKEQKLRIHLCLNINSKSQLIQCFLNCYKMLPGHILIITLDNLLTKGRV